MSHQHDTIAAIATPPGTGAVGMVRLSGPGVLPILEQIFFPCDRRPVSVLEGYSGSLGTVRDGARQVDEAVLFLYRAPRSYTGEDVAELCVHGGAYLVGEVLRVCVAHGARPAGPGEFTRRAFLGGKMALTQAEAVCDLIAAQGEGARRAALSARRGALSTGIANLLETLTAASAHLAAWSDYPEEDLVPVDTGDLAASLARMSTQARTLLETFGKGQLLQQGILTAIVGKPNVGKSTLMNLLSGYRRSIVTDRPGTTRDIVSETVPLGDTFLRLLDTAGIRPTEDLVEREGVALAKEQIASAQLILAVFDSSSPLDESDRALLELLRGTPCIAVVNKTDLPSQLDVEELAGFFPNLVFLSAASGSGREELEHTILALVGLEGFDAQAPVIANERQRDCLVRALDSLDQALEALQLGLTLDAVNVCIDEALQALYELSGERASEKIVEQVFARFCVGK